MAGTTGTFATPSSGMWTCPPPAWARARRGPRAAAPSARPPFNRPRRESSTARLRPVPARPCQFPMTPLPFPRSYRAVASTCETSPASEGDTGIIAVRAAAAKPGIPYPHVLSTAEARLASLPPGFMRLGLVLAHLQHHEAVGVDQGCVRDVGDVLSAVHRLLDHAYGQRRQSGDVVGDRHGLGHQLRVWHQPLGEADAMGLVGLEREAHGDPHRRSLADDAGEPRRAAIV